MTETAHASGAAPDGERLLVQILGDARDDDGQLRALHRAIEAAVALPLDAHVIGEPLVIVAVEYDGNARRGLVAHCRREDGSEYRIGLADVEMPARTPAARHAAAYRLWLGIVPDAGAPATTPRSRRQHKAGDDDLDLSRPVELVVLAVKERAARCRLLGGGRVITLRAGSLYGIVAGHIVRVAPNKHWRHAGHPYLSGQVAGTRIDARALGLVPLALRAATNVWEAGIEDRRAPDGRPRSAFELEVPPIPTGLAAAQIDDPDVVAAKLLEADLRFLDAHAYLADRLLGMSPQWALQQYEVGVGIGQLSVGDDFDGVLRGELAGNRGLLRCLSGYGSCLWRLERRDEAARVLERRGATRSARDTGHARDRSDRAGAREHRCAGDVRDAADRERQRAPPRRRRVPKVVQRETRSISVACRCSSHAQVDHQPGYYGAAMGTEAVRFLVTWMAGWIHSRQLEVIDFLREENRVLREQLGGRRLRFTDDQRRRLAVKGKTVGRRRLGAFAGLVTPDTILRWYRELIARKYDGSARRRAGRPTVAMDMEQLVVRMATENPTWGYTRLVGALNNLGHQIGRNTVKRVLPRHGLEPAPTRGKRMPWKTFLRMHLGAIAAADFFSVEVLTLTGLVRYLVLFVIDHQTRRVQIGGVVRQPCGAWMRQVARNLTDGVDGFPIGKRYLIHDRDPLFTDEFRSVPAAAGVKCLRLPARSPDLNSVAERFVLSIKNECLSKLVPLGESHLRRSVSEYIEHYHCERNHQGWATGCLRPPNRRCDPPTRTRRSSAASGSADCSTSTTGPQHEPIDL